MKRRTPKNETMYKQYRNILNSVIENAKIIYYREQIEHNKENGNRIWQTLNQILRRNKKQSEISV